jgi:hypothetical protein
MSDRGEDRDYLRGTQYMIVGHRGERPSMVGRLTVMSQFAGAPFGLLS